MTLKPHKFKHSDNGNAGPYSTVVYCEYCGLVAFHANNTIDTDKRFNESKKGCPLSPDLDKFETP